MLLGDMSPAALNSHRYFGSQMNLRHLKVNTSSMLAGVWVLYPYVLILIRHCLLCHYLSGLHGHNGYQGNTGGHEGKRQNSFWEYSPNI